MSQSNNNKLTNIILNGNKNYIPWSRSVTTGLGGKGKLNFVTGTKEKPKANDPDKATDAEKAKIEEWETTDQMIMSWLLSTMELQISNVLMYSNSSKEVWDKARRRHGQQKNFVHIFSLKQELSQIKQGNQSNNELVTEIMSNWKELNVYLPPTTDPIETQERAEMPSFDDVVARIEQEQSRRALMNPRQIETTENKAFKAHHPNPNPRESAKTRRTTATDWYDHCKRAGHNREGCWVLHPHLRPA